ncbi:glycosyltransferase [Niveibacterium sp.]|uniref:glycosyltransferase n=1 Tax=Niveibacterium sp. TaxID=2017444 RepID=UPI0035AEF6C9
MGERPLRIAIVSNSDASAGGAGRVAEDLSRGLNAAGHEAIHWVAWTKQGYTPTRRRLYGELWQWRFGRAKRAIDKWFVPDLVPFELPNLYLQNLVANYDLVHFHFLSTAISPLTLVWFARRMPTTFTLHDTSAFTGGCINPLDCKRYLDSCGSCPQHGAWPIEGRGDWTESTRRLHRWMLAEPALDLIAPSAWLIDTLQGALRPGGGVTQIHNGIDTDVFRPATNKAALRERLGLAPDRPVVLVSSAVLDNPFKRVEEALPALNAVKPLRVQTVVMGAANAATASAFEQIETRFTGHLSDPVEIATWMAAADVLLYPSHGDNQPLTILEAMASGCAVVGYAIGGIPEIVPSGEAGLLVPKGDTAALAAALVCLIDDTPRLNAMQSRAAALVAARHTLPRMIDLHLSHYRQLIARRKTAADPDAIARTQPAAFHDMDERSVCRELLSRALRAGHTRIAIYGAGKLGFKMIEAARQQSIDVVCVADGDVKLHGLEMLGYPICSLAQAAKSQVPCYVVASVAFATPIVAGIRSHYRDISQPCPAVFSINESAR